MADGAPDDLQQHFCSNCYAVVYVDQGSKRCSICKGVNITPSRLSRDHNEYVEKYRAFHASQKPAPKSSIKEMEEYEITEDLLEQQPICPVCQEEFEVGDMVKSMPCGHLYHKQCADSWLGGQKNSCALCNATLPQVYKSSYQRPPLSGGGGSSSGASFSV